MSDPTSARPGDATSQPSYTPAPGGYAPPPAPYGAAGYPAPPYTTPQGGAGYAAPPKTNVLAVISMIASIVGVVGILPIIGSIAGAIMGHISLGQIKESGEQGRGMALAGVIVGWAGLGIVILIIAAILLFIFGVGAIATTQYS